MVFDALAMKMKRRRRRSIILTQQCYTITYNKNVVVLPVLALVTTFVIMVTATDMGVPVSPITAHESFGASSTFSFTKQSWQYRGGHQLHGSPISESYNDDDRQDDDAEENARLDAYIESLLATVEDGSTTDESNTEFVEKKDAARLDEEVDSKPTAISDIAPVQFSEARPDTGSTEDKEKEEEEVVSDTSIEIQKKNRIKTQTKNRKSDGNVTVNNSDKVVIEQRDRIDPSVVQRKKGSVDKKKKALKKQKQKEISPKKEQEKQNFNINSSDKKKHDHHIESKPFTGTNKKTLEKQEEKEISGKKEQEEQKSTIDSSNEQSENKTFASALPSLDKGTIPNPLFRFLLHRGRVGHILVMMMAIFLDWIAVYLPPVSHSLNWIYVRAVPTRIRKPPQSRRRQQQQQDVTTAAAAATALARTGASKKKQRQMMKEADQAALEIIKNLDFNSRYRFVSVDFMKRHSLGPYRTQQNAGKSGDHALSPTTLIPISGINGTGKTKVKTKRKKSLSSTAKTEPEDWVLQALLRDNKTGSGRQQQRIRPTVSVQLGANNGVGVSLGLEVGNNSADSTVRESRRTREEYRQSVVDAVNKQQSLMPPLSNRRDKLMKQQRASDESSGIMGKIRSSSLSRGLLGAYPGDALPVEEAADSAGLSRLAERYGYKDIAVPSNSLEDVDEDDEESTRITSRLKVSKRRKRREDSALVTPDQAPKDDILNDSDGDLIDKHGEDQTSGSYNRANQLAETFSSNNSRGNSIAKETPSRRKQVESLLSGISRAKPTLQQNLGTRVRSQKPKEEDELPRGSSKSRSDTSDLGISKSIPGSTRKKSNLSKAIPGSTTRNAALDRIKDLTRGNPKSGTFPKS